MIAEQPLPLDLPSFQTLEIAEVKQADNGVPQVLHQSKDDLKVILVNHSLPYVETGNYVVFSRMPQGAMVLYQIEPAKDHVPTYLPQQPHKKVIKMQTENAEIKIHSDGFISLKAHEHEVVLNHLGHFLCQANQIYMSAKEQLNLEAPANQVKINTRKTGFEP